MRSLLLKLRHWLVPAKSRREHLYHALRVAGVIVREAGWRAFFQRYPWWLRTYVREQNPAESSSLGSWIYQRWIKANEPKKADLQRQRAEAQALPHQPLITILTPVYNPDPRVLEDTLQSVIAQTYPNWEMCLADGASDKPGVRAVLEEYARRDSRIRVRFLEQNLGISANSNAALEMAQGEYVQLLDHDDLLAPNALFEVAQRIHQDPEVDILYFDEDKISADGRQRHSPWLKPEALSPDLLLSTNYLFHSVIRRSLLLETGQFDPTVDGAQDLDLSLRLLEKNPRLAHIPHIVYHWRQVPGSAASDANAKPWAYTAQKRCLEAHLQRLGYPQARVDFPSLGTVHIRWPLSGQKVSIIIPTKDKVEVLRACLDSIFSKTTYPDYEIILVDNGSTEPETLAYYETLADEPRLTLLHDTAPFNFHRVCNLGARHARGEVFIFLNNDTEALDPAWLDELVGWAERPEVGVVGAKLLRPNGTIQHAGIVIGLAGHGSHVFDGGREHLYGPFGSTEWYRNYQAVTGACMALRRSVFEQLGGFDEVYQVGYGDIDLCLRAVDAGYRVIYNPFARLLHHEGASRGFSLPPADVLRASVSMYPRIQAGDPYYSPHLSPLQRVPTLALPGETTSTEIIFRIMQSFDLISSDDMDAGDPARWQVPLRGETPEPRPDKARILVISHELSRSGAPFIIWQIARSLAKRGHPVTVLSPFDGPLHQACLEDGMAVHILPSLMKDARVALPYMVGQDLVIANTILTFRTIHAAKASGLPALFYIHESGFGQNQCRTFPGVAAAVRGADRLIFSSNATASLYNEFSDPQRLAILYTGLEFAPPDPQTFTPPFERQPGKLYLVTVASIESRKGQDVLLRAMEGLPAQVASQVECFLIGRILYKLEKSFCERIVQKAEQMGNVHVLGEIPAAEVKRYLTAADIFVLPSRDESLPVSLIEAMALGKPSIVTDVGGVNEMVEDEVSALIIASEDHLALSKCIQKLSQEPDFRYNLGIQAQRAYQQKLTLERFQDQFYALVVQVLRGQG